MKAIRKITALISAILIVLRLTVLNTFALPAAPVIAAEELEAFLATFLYGAGACSQDQLSNMSLSQMQETLKNGLADGTINPAGKVECTPLYDSNSGTYTEEIPIYDPDTGTWKEAIPWRVTIGEEYEPANVFELFKSLYGFDSEWVSVSKCSALDEAQRAMLKDVKDKINLTLSTDLSGAVSVMECCFDDGHRVIYYSNSPGTYNPSNGSCVMNTDSLFREVSYDQKGNCIKDKILDPPSNVRFGYLKGRHGTRCTYIYGNWLLYGSEAAAETDDEEIPIIGEAAGTAVTPDMLNPDGSVTIDGTTYYPQDYIDWDKFKDTAIIDLLNDILARLDNAYIVEQDKDTAQDIVGDISVDLDIGELNNFKMPATIVDVFPFCLPFDFVRGFKGLIAKPEIPVFKSELDLTDICGYDLGKHTIEVSLEKWEPAVVIFRWFSLILFSYTLILITGKIVKGAGA